MRAVDTARPTAPAFWRAQVCIAAVAYHIEDVVSRRRLVGSEREPPMRANASRRAMKARRHGVCLCFALSAASHTRFEARPFRADIEERARQSRRRVAHLKLLVATRSVVARAAGVSCCALDLESSLDARPHVPPHRSSASWRPIPRRWRPSWTAAMMTRRCCRSASAARCRVTRRTSASRSLATRAELLATWSDRSRASAWRTS